MTSDSIAAWVARAVGARDLLVIKPPHAAGADLVDPYFAETSEGIRTEVIPAHDIEALRLATRR